jgi:hypothetical protein
MENPEVIGSWGLASSMGHKILRFFDSEGYYIRDGLCVRAWEE